MLRLQRKPNHDSMMQSWFFVALLTTAFCSGIGCISKPASIPPIAVRDELFVEATDKLGIHFNLDPGDTNDYFVPKVMGSGVAIFDADGDGRQDVLFLQNSGPNSHSKNKLYRQTPDGKFEDVSAGSGLDFAGHNMGVAVGDIDGDGLPDIVITQYPGVKVFRNLGSFHFSDATATCGVSNPHWGTSVSFVDYDLDGKLDLFIANYVDFDRGHTCENSTQGGREFCGPSSFTGVPSKLFRNLGKTGADVKFEDVSMSSHIGKSLSPGLGVYCADLTGDGWPDIFVTNDARPNFLWVNQKNGTFVEDALPRGVAYNSMGQVAANMGIGIGDVNRDGLLDLFVTHLTTESNTLWVQEPLGFFKDRTIPTKAATTKWRGTGFGTLMADFDCDGDVDIAIVNGRIARGATHDASLPKFWQNYSERNQILHNNGGSFTDISSDNPAFCNYGNVGRGLAVGDLNGDGFPDLVTTAIGGPARIFINAAKSANHWLVVRALTPSGAPAIGAEVRLTMETGNQLRVIQPSESYLSSSQPDAFFGLGRVDDFRELRVRWPDGTSTILPAGKGDRIVTVRQSGNPKTQP